MTSTYTYDILNHFPGTPGSVNTDKLKTEIASDSRMTIALDSINTGSGGVESRIDFVFRSDLSASEIQVLDGRTMSSVLGVQTDSSLDPGTPSLGDRYIITDSSDMHANFGVVDGISDNFVVEFNGLLFEVDFEADDTALVYNESDSQFYAFDNSSWSVSKAGGLIAAHDNTSSLSDATEVRIVNEVPIKKSSKASNKYYFSPNICDKTTWWMDSIQITDESPTLISGETRKYQLSKGSVEGEVILDLNHGKVTDETNIRPPSGDKFGYLVSVSVDDVLQTERGYAKDSGGDYEIDYNNGVLTFFEELPTGSSVSVDYWYVPVNAVGWLFQVSSPLGTEFNVEYVEAQFSNDMVYDDDIIYTVVPQILPFVSLQDDLVYKNMHNIIDYSISALPEVQPKLGTRGIGQSMTVIPWNYISELTIPGEPQEIPGLGFQKVMLVARLGEGKPFGGSRATIAIYGTERPVDS